MNHKNKLLPAKKVTTRYHFKTWSFLPTETTTTSQGDPTNTCTTITTTTHYAPEY